VLQEQEGSKGDSKIKPRSIMDYSVGQLAGYTVKDMQQSDYIKVLGS